MSDFRRIPPQNIDAEMSLLGALLLGDPAATEEAVSILSAGDFYRTAHSAIFESIQGLVRANEPVDIVTLRDELQKRRDLDSAGGVPYLMALSDYVPTTANIAYYAKIVREKATLRRLIEQCSLLTQMAYEAPESVSALLEDAERRILALRPKDGDETNHTLKSLIGPEMDAIEARGKQSGKITGLPTGFSSLDWMLSGMQPGDLILLAARPSLGKTALATAIAANVTKAGGTTQFFSLEMSRSQVVQRMLTAEGRVDSHNVRTGQMASADWEKLVEGSQRLWEGECLIDDNSLITPSYMRSVCRRTKAKHGLDLVIVDYLQLMNGGSGDSKPGENRNAELSDISRSLKLLAKEFQCPVLALSQLSRNVEKRENKRPMLADLRDSGSLEQDADVVMFLYRESYQADGGTAATPEDAYKPDPTEVIIRKQRMGPTGTVSLGFVSAYTRFEELAPEGLF